MGMKGVTMVSWLIHWRESVLAVLIGLMVLGSVLGWLPPLAMAAWWMEWGQWWAGRWSMVRRRLRTAGWLKRILPWLKWGRDLLAMSVLTWLLFRLLDRQCGVEARLLLLCLANLSSKSVSIAWQWACQQVLLLLSPPDGCDEVVAGIDEPIDLSSLVIEFADVPLTAADDLTAKERRVACIERIRATCFQHPVSVALQERLEEVVLAEVRALIEGALEAELSQYLGFERYERTGGAKPPEKQRSGHHSRALEAQYGVIKDLRVPKLRRGNKAIEWQVIEKYERSFGPWLDLKLHLYTLGLSQADLQEILQLSLGQVVSVKAIEHLTNVVHQEMTAFRQAKLTDTPPVMLIDGVNVVVRCPTGEVKTNQRGQQRAVTEAQKRVILAALGVWPDGRYQLLHFQVVEQETKAAWRGFFGQLLDKKLDPITLQLIVSDGRPGIGTAIRSVFRDTVRHQRCIFHKLKNLADNLTFANLVLDPNLPHREAVKRAKEERACAILSEAAAIYEGTDVSIIRERAEAFRRHWAAVEPKAVRCFFRDFDLTLNYLRVNFPHKRLIRTTNLLERFFREFRSRADEIGCFGSLSQAQTVFYLIARREKAKRGICAA